MANPAKIGRYEIVEELGRGGMATVYAALDPRFKRKVALKVLPRHFLHDPNFVSRFESEAQFIASLEHPAIVPVYDFGGLDDQPYLVMRLLSGGSLAQRIRATGALPPAEVSEIMTRLSAALDKAHEHGIIHRDLKPDNILFDEENRPYLTDFGIARLSEATHTMTIIGTPAYMSPEQWEGHPLDARSDIYALGVILYEMLTGRRPYHSDTPASLMREHLTSPVPDPLTLRPDLAPVWRNVIQHALAKNPDERYSNARALAAAVAQAAAGLAEVAAPEPKTVARPAPPLAQTEVIAPPAAPAAAPPAAAAPREEWEQTEIIEAPSDPKLAQEVGAPPVEQWDETEVLAAPPGPEFGEPAPVKPAPPQPAPPAAAAKARPWRRYAMMAGGLVLLVLIIGGVIFAGALLNRGGDATEVAAATATPEADGEAVATRPAATATATLEPMPELVPVVGDPPSQRIGAFYYPWFGDPAAGPDWLNQDAVNGRFPLPLGSDYFPLMGPYNTYDPQVVAQHFAWLRQANIGLAITSWWGPGSPEDEVVPLLLEMGERYDIAVAFVIESYRGRNSQTTMENIDYLLERYGQHPAFFHSPRPSRFETGSSPKAVFFVADPIGSPESWRGPVDTLHVTHSNVIVIANETDPAWTEQAHFDGLYNDLFGDDGFFAATPCLPEGTWFVPVIAPGYSQSFVPDSPYQTRLSGFIYELGWTDVRNAPEEPELIVVNSFNNWLEGTQIEPADAGRSARDYGSLEPDAYLALTAQLSREFLTGPSNNADVLRARFHVTTTSDWAKLSYLRGSMLTCFREENIDAVEGWMNFSFAGQGEAFDNVLMGNQPPEIEERVPGTFVFDLVFVMTDPHETIDLRLQQGCLGETQIEILDLATSRQTFWETGDAEARCATGMVFNLAVGDEFGILP